MRRSVGRPTASRRRGRLAEYLQLYLEGKPLPIRPPTTAEMIGRWVRGHKGLVGTAATAAIAIVVTVAIAFLLITRSRDVAKQRADEKAALADEKAALANGLRNALNSVETERNHAIQESRKAFQSLSDFYLERGRALVNGRDTTGLLWMAPRWRPPLPTMRPGSIKSGPISRLRLGSSTS